MNYKQFSHTYYKHILILTLGLFIIPNYIPLLAQSNSPNKLIQFKPLRRGTPPSTRGGSTFVRGRGGSTREDCLYKKELPPFMGLVGFQGDDNFKLTINQSPTFLVYVPYTPQESPNGTFYLQDKEGKKGIYSIKFQLPATPGIVSITLPPDQILEVNRTYRWHFEIICPTVATSKSTTPKSTTPESPTTVNFSGFVKIISPSETLKNELNSAKTPIERIAIYANNGIWYETITELAQLRFKDPNDPILKNIWVDLLSDENVGLKEYAQEPIAGEIITNSPIK